MLGLPSCDIRRNDPSAYTPVRVASVQKTTVSMAWLEQLSSAAVHLHLPHRRNENESS